MAKAFSLVSWNVEHFSKRKVSDVIPFLRHPAGGNAPDVFAIYEVTGKDVYNDLMIQMPNYNFFISEGEQVQEILLGVKQGLRGFITQRDEFKSKQLTLRPGVLLTLRIAAQNYSLLFLHTKSMPDPKGFGLRDDMLDSAFNLKRALDKQAGGHGKAHFLIVGDLNTMGLQYPTKSNTLVSGAEEIAALTRSASYKRMRLLSKNAPFTWSNGSRSSIGPSNLDHVLASKHLTFTQFDGRDIDVRGWPKEPTPAAQDEWIRTFSDHALLYLEVQQAI